MFSIRDGSHVGIGGLRKNFVFLRKSKTITKILTDDIGGRLRHKRRRFEPLRETNFLILGPN